MFYVSPVFHILALLHKRPKQYVIWLEGNTRTFWKTKSWWRCHWIAISLGFKELWHMWKRKVRRVSVYQYSGTLLDYQIAHILSTFEEGFTFRVKL